MKRVFDLVISTVATILLSPFLGLIWVIIKIDSKGPALFCQRRIGRNDQEFTMFKFRSMVVGTPEVATDKLNNSQNYMTRIGYFLRKYSIDELPQLINIVLGDMSIVGPRPALYNQHDLRSLRNQYGISQIRPGLTGWAQVNGRDEITLEQKVELDLYYLRNQSSLLDLDIIFRTAFSVYHGNGLNVKSNKGQASCHFEVKK